MQRSSLTASAWRAQPVRAPAAPAPAPHAVRTSRLACPVACRWCTCLPPPRQRLHAASPCERAPLCRAGSGLGAGGSAALAPRQPLDRELVEQAAALLRQELRLWLFGFDVLVESASGAPSCARPTLTFTAARLQPRPPAHAGTVCFLPSHVQAFIYSLFQAFDYMYVSEQECTTSWT